MTECKHSYVWNKKSLTRDPNPQVPYAQKDPEEDYFWAPFIKEADKKNGEDEAS